MSSQSNIKMRTSISMWLRYHFIEKKLSTWFGMLLLCGIAVGIGYSSIEVDYRSSVGVLFIFISIFAVMLFLRYPYFGLYFLLVFTSLTGLISRMLIDSAIGINFTMVIYALTILVWLSLVGKKKLPKLEESNFWQNPITLSMIIPLLFYVIEALNPSMFSLSGWFSYFFRNITFFITFYFLFVLLNSWKTTKYFIYFNIILITLLAAYSCKQQWLGLTSFELRWVTRDPQVYFLLFQGGFLRKWSTLSDPAASGVLFSSVSLTCIFLMLRDPDRRVKIWMGIAAIINLLGYSFSGTRTGTLMIVAGIAFYGVATIFEKRTLLFLIGTVGAFVLLMVSPYSPPAVTRIKSTFQGTKDASAAVRDYDRHQVQPYLFTHPLGGGIYTSGFEGPKYNPGHYLENFQPDSGYMKVLAEQGCIGLLILLITYYMILKLGLRNFYKSKNPEMQTYCIALLGMVFSLMVGQYAQFATGLYPQIIFYLGALVFFVKMPYFEAQEKNS